MGNITALRLNSRKKQVDVFIDGLYSFTLTDELAVNNHLQIGRELSEKQIEELREADLFHTCMDAAVHYLGYRPRSEKEVRQRLRRRQFDRSAIEEVILKLKAKHLIDDAAFSEYWRDNRLSFSPRSARLVKVELRQKGVAAETADEIVKDVDDEKSAYEAGLKKARRLVALQYQDFHNSLYEYLRRRGFNHEVISLSIQRLWQEKESGSFQ